MRGTPKRRPVNKAKSARAFRHGASKTHKLNTPSMMRRGGWRL